MLWIFLKCVAIISLKQRNEDYRRGLGWNTLGKKSEDRHIFKYRQHKNIEKIEEKNENKRKKG